MSEQLTYQMVMDISSSWNSLKMVENYEIKAGYLMFEKLFALEPNAKSVLGFSDSEDIERNPRFPLLANIMIDMIDCAVAFLGPDLEPLTEHLVDLGARHVHYKVKPEYLSKMGPAVIYALEEVLGSKFSQKDAKNWTFVFQFMVSKMILGMK